MNEIKCPICGRPVNEFGFYSICGIFPKNIKK